MKLSANIALTFDGQCEAAFRRYERCLNGSITFMLTWGDSPMVAPPDWGAKINHATLKIGDTVLNGSDPLPEQYQKPQGFSLILQMDDPVAAEQVFQALSENGTIQMPLQETFWAKRFAALVDQFGIPWAINCE